MAKIDVDEGCGCFIVLLLFFMSILLWQVTIQLETIIKLLNK